MCLNTIYYPIFTIIFENKCDYKLMTLEYDHLTCTFSDIGCTSPVWTVCVRWYPHYAFTVVSCNGQCQGIQLGVSIYAINLLTSGLPTLNAILCIEQNVNNQSLTQFSQLYVHVFVCLEIIRSWLNLPTGGHGHVICIGEYIILWTHNNKSSNGFIL